MGSAFDVLKGKKSDWAIDEIGELTGLCLKFLVKVGGLLPESTVGLSQRGEFDMLKVTREGSEWLKQARFEASGDRTGRAHQEAKAVSSRTERTLQQGKALVHAVEALETLETIQKSGPLERVMVWFLLEAYRQRLRAIIEAAPSWVGEEVLSASQVVGRDKAAVWLIGSQESDSVCKSAEGSSQVA